MSTITFKIIPGAGVSGRVVVEFQGGFGCPYRLDKQSLASAIENLKRNRGHFRTEEAYQKRLAFKQGAWNALIEWEAKQDSRK